MSTRAYASRRARAAWCVLACLAAGAGLLATPGAVRAQTPENVPAIEVTYGFEAFEATIGDRIALVLTAHHGGDVIVSAEPPQLEHVEVVSSAVEAAPAGGERETTTFRWVLQPFTGGAIDTGPLRLGWLRADGDSGSLEVPAATLDVIPVRAPDDDALRPLKPQETIGGGPAAWIRPAQVGGVLAVLCIAAAVVALVVRRRRARTAEAPEVDVSAERRARDRLDALAAQAHPRDGDYQGYYGGMALAVREYLGARFGFNAYALTTRELEQRMVSHGVDRWQARLVGGLLERCDAAVFAHRYPDPASADHDLTVAYEIVELSRPQALEEPVAV